MRRLVPGLLATVLWAGSWSAALSQDDASDPQLAEADDAWTGESPTVVPAPVPVRVPSPLTTASTSPLAVRVQPVRPVSRAKPVDPYAAQGINAGGFRLYPTLEIGGIASSNPARVSGGDGDIGLRLAPGLRAESDWVRHQFNLSAAGDFLWFLDETDLSTSTASASADLRLDVRHDLTAELDADYSLNSTPASSSEVPAAAASARHDQTFSMGAALTRAVGVVALRGRLGLTRNAFDDVDLVGGGSEDNSDRNYTEPSLSLRGTMRTGAVLQPFAELAYEPRFHDKTKDRNGEKRNSQGLRLTAGISLHDDPLWTGEAGLSLLVRSYADDGLDTVLAPGLAASVVYRPTDLTQITLSASGTIAETAVAGASARRIWSAGLNGRHQIRDNLALTGGIGFTADNSDAGTDWTSNASAGIIWDANPVLGFKAGYDGTWFAGENSASDYADHRLTTSIILKR